jgi:hypothetical protein
MVNDFLVVSVRINDTIDARMTFDTGVGLTAVSKQLCERSSCKIGGTYTGRRMSGQGLTVQLARIGSLTVAGQRDSDVQVAVFDATGWLPAGIDGILSLRFFQHRPFTIERGGKNLIIEDRTSLDRRRATGAAVPVRIDDDGVSVTVSMSLEVPRGPPARVEIDTGSYGLILDERYMSRLGVNAASPSVKTVRGKDESLHEYVRTFASIDGSIYPTGAPRMKQENPRVMFQKIIHDGLVGVSFLTGFSVTYNLPESQIILGER